jgi:hypothetical protein
MGGGLLQLVAYGAQDAYISGNPQITFFKGLYKRHTNFAMEAFRVNFNGQPSWGTKQTAMLGRNADLIYSTYVEVELKAGYYNNDQNRCGFNLIKYAELDIGGQVVDKMYGEFMKIWSDLSGNAAQKNMLDQMTGGKCTTGVVISSDGGAAASTTATPPGLGEGAYFSPGSRKYPGGNGLRVFDPTACTNTMQNQPVVLYVPLPLFFTRNPGAALPLIALQYHEVKINIQWNAPELIAGDYIGGGFGIGDGPASAALYCDYIYLDTEERRRMAQQSHEYLIEQGQFNEDKGIAGFSSRIDLTFNHPVKELVWVIQPESYTNCSFTTKTVSNGQRYDYPTDNGIRSGNPLTLTTAPTRGMLRPFTYPDYPMLDCMLQINGQERFSRRNGSYFNKAQIYQHHTGDNQDQGGLYVYSFALRPEEHQPSGTCNFSRIDTATLSMTLSGSGDHSKENAWTCRVYAINYNILRVMSGMGGLAYSN